MPLWLHLLHPSSTEMRTFVWFYLHNAPHTEPRHTKWSKRTSMADQHCRLGDSCLPFIDKLRVERSFRMWSKHACHFQIVKMWRTGQDSETAQTLVQAESQQGEEIIPPYWSVKIWLEKVTLTWTGNPGTHNTFGQTFHFSVKKCFFFQWFLSFRHFLKPEFQPPA